MKSLVMHLASTRYSETNHTHLSELLREREGVVIGRTTLRRILVGLALEVRAADGHRNTEYAVSECPERGC